MAERINDPTDTPTVLVVNRGPLRPRRQPLLSTPQSRDHRRRAAAPDRQLGNDVITRSDAVHRPRAERRLTERQRDITSPLYPQLRLDTHHHATLRVCRPPGYATGVLWERWGLKGTPLGHCYAPGSPHTTRAVSTTSCSLATCSS